MTTTDDELEAFLVNLEIMSLAALRAEWQTRWERPPVLRSPRLLRHLIAWRIQAACVCRVRDVQGTAYLSDSFGTRKGLARSVRA
ncbi:MAG: DUF2924 domain-containing protein, partial [Alphaproteobacteria bacterium]